MSNYWYLMGEKRPRWGDKSARGKQAGGKPAKGRKSQTPPARGCSGHREGVLCGMRKFEKVYFAEFHLWNVPQIIP